MSIKEQGIRKTSALTMSDSIQVGAKPGKINIDCRGRQFYCTCYQEKVQVGKDQEKAQSEKDSHSKNRGGKKPN